MSVQAIKFTCTALKGTELEGKIKKDADGYYWIPLGGLDIQNSAGEYYPYEESKALFESSSIFMQRVKAGRLRGELGHPKRLPGMTMEQFVNRCAYIHEDKVACHIADVSLEFNKVFDKNNKPIVAIMGRVCGSGPFADTFERSMSNPKEDFCMSIRSFTDDFVRGGRVQKVLKEIITWDVVNEPGLENASKFRSPTLEEQSLIVDRKVMEKAFFDPETGIALESCGFDANALFNRLGWVAQTRKRTIVSGW